jgi:alkylhydroperoxidase family enzyme
MAWIRMIPESEAEGELKAEYAGAMEPWGGVDNVATLKAHMLLYVTVMRGPSDLSRAQREMIAVVVSTANHCHY